MTRRLLAFSLGLALVALAALALPLGSSFAGAEEERLLGEVRNDAFAIAFFVEDDLDPQATDTGVDLDAVARGYLDRTGGRVVVTDRGGIALADGDPPAGEGAGRDLSTRPEVAEALAGRVASGIRPSETLGGRIVFVAVPVASGGEVDGAVRITYPATALDARIRSRWIQLAGLSLVTLALTVVVAVVLARSVVSPLRRLEHAAARLGAGDLSTRAAGVGGPPEVRTLAAGFDDMAARLERLVVAQDQFVADASHELRTPLTALRLRLHAIEAAGGEAVESEVDAAVAETARLTRMVDGLLALARADRPDREGRVPVDLGPFLDDRIDAWQPLADDAGVTLRHRAGDAPAAAIATPDRLGQVVDNLVANAIDASPSGSTVTLSARSDPLDVARVALHVTDQGHGLDADARARAFDRFWRGRDAKRGGSGLGGSGLGLAIVRKLVEADGGDVRLDEGPGGGVDAVVRLERAATPGR